MLKLNKETVFPMMAWTVVDGEIKQVKIVGQQYGTGYGNRGKRYYYRDLYEKKSGAIKNAESKIKAHIKGDAYRAAALQKMIDGIAQAKASK